MTQKTNDITFHRNHSVPPLLISNIATPSYLLPGGMWKNYFLLLFLPLKLSFHWNSHTHSHTRLTDGVGQAGYTVSLTASIKVWALRTASYAWNVSSPQAESKTYTWTHTCCANAHTWKNTLWHTYTTAQLKSHTHTHTLLNVCRRIVLHMKHSCTSVLFSWGSNRISSPSVLSTGHGLLHKHSHTHTQTFLHVHTHECMFDNSNKKSEDLISVGVKTEETSGPHMVTNIITWVKNHLTCSGQKMGEW